MGADESADRSYQSWCLKQAKRENVIVCLPTGAGKTRIAVRLLQHYKALLANPTLIAVFLAPTVSLCMQQGRVLSRAGLRTAVLAMGAIEEMESPTPSSSDDDEDDGDGEDGDGEASDEDQAPSTCSDAPSPRRRSSNASTASGESGGRPGPAGVNGGATGGSKAGGGAGPAGADGGEAGDGVAADGGAKPKANAKQRRSKKRAQKRANGDEESGAEDGGYASDDGGNGSDASVGAAGSYTSTQLTLPRGSELGKKLSSGTLPFKRMEMVVAGHEVLVATPGELLHCLTHALITVPRIRWLILDEAHHVSSQHGYVQLLNNFVMRVPPSQRPRLLGLTATPLQVLEREPHPLGNKAVLLHTCSLEKLTGARVISTDDWSEVEATVPVPTQRLIRYRQAPLPPTCALQHTMTALAAARQQVLLTCGGLREARLGMKQQEALMKRLGTAAQAAHAGILTPSGTSVYHYLAGQLAAVEACIMELGLWAGLIMAQHSLLSTTDTALAMDLDPDLELEDSDDDEEQPNSNNTTNSRSASPAPSTTTTTADTISQRDADMEAADEVNHISTQHGNTPTPTPTTTNGDNITNGGDTTNGDNITNGGDTTMATTNTSMITNGGDITISNINGTNGTSVAINGSNTVSMSGNGSKVNGPASRAESPCGGAVGAGAVRCGMPAPQAGLLLPQAGYQHRWQLQLHSILVQRRKQRRDLEKKLRGTLSPGQVAQLQRAHGKKLVNGERPGRHLPGSKDASKGSRYYAALEERAGREAIMSALTALSDVTLHDSDLQYEFIKDVGAVLHGSGLMCVLEGMLARFMPRLLPGPDKLQALLADCTSTAEEHKADEDRWFSVKMRTLLGLLLNPPRSAPTTDPETGVTVPGSVQGTMVFFSRKVYVIAVHELLQLLPVAGSAGLKSAPFLGDTGQASLSRCMSMGMLAQQRVMQEFRQGITNLLLATHVGAEGLDFGCCSRVVLLDVPTHVVQLTQCKGRARMQNSECLILMPTGSGVDERKLERLNRLETAMIEVTKYKTKLFIAAQEQAARAAATGDTTTTAMLPPPPRFTALPSDLPEPPPPPPEDEDPLPVSLPTATGRPSGAAKGRAGGGAGSGADNAPAGPEEDGGPAAAAFTMGISGLSAVGPRRPGLAEPGRPGFQEAGSEDVLPSLDAAGRDEGGAGSTGGVALLPDYVVPKTGARCTPCYAEALVQQYCCSLSGKDEFAQLKPQFLVCQHDEYTFTCTIVLPSNSRSDHNKLMFTGPMCKGARSSRAAASLEAVRALHADNLLDDHLEPASMTSRLAQEGGKWHATLAARLVDGEIYGVVPVVRLPMKLPAILKPLNKALAAKNTTTTPDRPSRDTTPASTRSPSPATSMALNPPSNPSQRAGISPRRVLLALQPPDVVAVDAAQPTRNAAQQAVDAAGSRAGSRQVSPEPVGSQMETQVTHHAAPVASGAHTDGTIEMVVMEGGDTADTAGMRPEPVVIKPEPPAAEPGTSTGVVVVPSGHGGLGQTAAANAEPRAPARRSARHVQDATVPTIAGPSAGGAVLPGTVGLALAGANGAVGMAPAGAQQSPPVRLSPRTPTRGGRSPTSSGGRGSARAKRPAPPESGQESEGEGQKGALSDLAAAGPSPAPYGPAATPPSQLPSPVAAPQAAPRLGSSGAQAAGGSMPPPPARVVRHLYGWVVQPCTAPSNQIRGPLSADVYTLDGPWPDQPRLDGQARPTSGLSTPSLGSPAPSTPTAAISALTRAMSIDGAGAAQTATPGSPVATGAGAATTTPVGPAATVPGPGAQVDEASYLYPFGVLLHNAIPTNACLPYSIWLPGKQHALVTSVHLGSVKLSPEQLVALQAGHASLLALATTKRLKAGKADKAAAAAAKPAEGKADKAAAGKPAGVGAAGKVKPVGQAAVPGGVPEAALQPAELGAAGSAQPAGPAGTVSAPAGAAQPGAEAVAAAGVAAAAEMETDLGVATAGLGQRAEVTVAAAAEQAGVPMQVDPPVCGGGGHALPSDVPGSATEAGGAAAAAADVAAPQATATLGEKGKTGAGKATKPRPTAPTTLQGAFQSWCARASLPQLRDALRAAGKEVHPALPPGDAGPPPPSAVRQPASPWFLVTPVTACQPGAGKQAAKRRRTSPEQEGVPALPHTVRPKLSGKVNWELLTRLAAGPSALQDMVDLGPFALPPEVYGGSPPAGASGGNTTSRGLGAAGSAGGATPVAADGTPGAAGTAAGAAHVGAPAHVATLPTSPATPQQPSQTPTTAAAAAAAPSTNQAGAPFCAAGTQPMDCDTVVPGQASNATCTGGEADATVTMGAVVSQRIDAALQNRIVIPAYAFDSRMVYLGPAATRPAKPPAASNPPTGQDAGAANPLGPAADTAGAVDVSGPSAAALAVDRAGAPASAAGVAGPGAAAPAVDVAAEPVPAPAAAQPATDPAAPTAVPVASASAAALSTAAGPMEVDGVQQQMQEVEPAPSEQPEKPLMLDDPVLGGTHRSAAKSSGAGGAAPAAVETYRTRFDRQFPWLKVQSLPPGTPLVSAEQGTTRYVKRNLTKPPGTENEKIRRKRPTRTAPKDAPAQPASGAGCARVVEDLPAADATQAAGPVGAVDGQATQVAATAGAPAPTQAAANPAGEMEVTTTGPAVPTAAVDLQVVGGSTAASSSDPVPSTVAREGTAVGPTVMEAQPAAPAVAAAAPAAPAAAPVVAGDGRHLVLPEGAKVHEAEVHLPGALLVHPLQLDEWAALLGMPALVRRMQAMASVQEWRDIVMPHIWPRAELPPLRDILVCFTPRRTNESYNYEGAELLGDCVLDYLAATHLFHALPHEDEGVLTECKVRLVANEVLLRLTHGRTEDPQQQGSQQQGASQGATGGGRDHHDMDADTLQVANSMRKRSHIGAQQGGGSKWHGVLPLQQYIQARPFDSEWEWTVGADIARAKERGKKVRGKVVGDVVEALIGAFFLSCGGAVALRLASAALGPEHQPHQQAAQVDGNMEEAGREEVAGLRHWDHQGLARALVSTAKFLHEVQLVPGSYEILAAVHQNSGVPADPRAVDRVKDAVKRAEVGSKQRQVDIKLAEALTPVLGGYVFRRPELLRESLTHCSHPVVPCNQRLEFLGDAALDMVITCHLAAASSHAAMLKRPTARLRGEDILDPGVMTDRRNRLVSNKHLSVLCVRCGLHAHMRIGLPAVRRLIARFEENLAEFEAKDREEYEEEKRKEAEAAALGLDYEKKRRKYGKSTGAPKLLADLIEAVLGAVLIDSGGDLAEVWRVLWGLVERAGMQDLYLIT